ncbi:hypothetical protein L3V82_00380 [Thiotrichales bacterium 19S3-7]|nr:hypothetical protein [Thiotrichales bacterium 19S3-7]MCF6800619.1 hypothetical protein [Thiotrichales bacterium 19S3-11]
MTSDNIMMNHSDIELVLENIYMVTGSNLTTFEGVRLQHSRNMIILKEGNELTLINSVRLSEAGLNALDQLGHVKQILRIGSFHGRDDAFYKDRYPEALLWALTAMTDEHHAKIDGYLDKTDQLPVANMQVIPFIHSNFPEACLYLNTNGGVLISCDSIKNWIDQDPYFSDETAKLYRSQNFFAKASISDIWIQATGVKRQDFEPILALDFKHLLSAHGAVLLNDAKVCLIESLAKIRC